MTMYEYTATPDTIRRVEDGAFIPNDPANTDYVAYLSWVEAGNETAPYIPPPPAVPTSTSKLGLKRAFAEMGQWDAVKGMIASNDDMQEEWDLAIEIKRTDILVQAMIVQMSLTDEQVDQLLIRAKELVG